MDHRISLSGKIDNRWVDVSRVLQKSAYRVSFTSKGSIGARRINLYFGILVMLQELRVEKRALLKKRKESDEAFCDNSDRN